MKMIDLISFRELDKEALAVIRKKWRGGRRFEFTEKEVFVVKKWRRSTYNVIRRKLRRDFIALIVRTKAYHGHEDPQLWKWLSKRTEL